MAPEPIPTVYFINPSHQSVCMYVSLFSLLGYSSVKTLPRHEYTSKNRRIAGRVCLWVCLCIPLSLPGNKGVSAATKNCCWCRFLCGQCRIKGTHAISFSQKYLLEILISKTTTILKNIRVYGHDFME
jgi:hypothetical protein